VHIKIVYASSAPHAIPHFHQLAQTHYPHVSFASESRQSCCTVSKRGAGPALQLDLLRRSPAVPQRQAQPAAPVPRGCWWGDPHSHSDRPFPRHQATGLDSAELAAMFKIHRGTRSKAGK